MHTRSLRVVAIGGSASVGKTSIAHELSARLGLHNLVHVDDLIPAVERASGRCFAAQPGVWSQPVASLFDQLRAWTSQLHGPIDVAVRKLNRSGGGIIEGEGIEPALAATWSSRVATVLVIENDAAALRETFIRRPSRQRFLDLTSHEQDAVTGMNARYGRWLAREAARHSVPCVPCRPWADLADRALAALDTRPRRQP